MKKIYTILLATCLAFAWQANGQSVGINEDGADPDGSAILDVQSTSKGVILPRMNKEERDAISNPVEGLMIYQTDNCPGLRVFNGSFWTLLHPAMAFVYDKKDSEVGAGQANANQWQTRNLNTIEGDINVAEIGTDQFTLQPGLYMIEGSAPAYRCDRHQTRVWNLTKNQIALRRSGEKFLGTSENAASEYTGNSRSFFSGMVEVTTQTNYRIDQFLGESSSSNLGVGNSSGEDEIYTTVKITKLAD